MRRRSISRNCRSGQDLDPARKLRHTGRQPRRPGSARCHPRSPKAPARASPATEVVHSGRGAACQLRLRQPADLSRLDRAFPDHREAVEARSGIYLRPLVNADRDRAGGGDRAKSRAVQPTALTASGYQAVSTAIFAFVKAGDHILMVDSVYQPTRKFCDCMLAKLGVETTYYDPLIGAGIDDTGARLTRASSSPRAPARRRSRCRTSRRSPRVAAERDLWLLHGQHLGDAAYFRPFEHGVDVSIQAATKYIVGHADAMLGAITSNERAAKHIAKAKESLGVCPGSEETYPGAARPAHARNAASPSTSAPGSRSRAG